ncbi:hypothetical protein FB567DRAFT_201959 [Paraphoma chrysanthemicola]|uniref:Uncharacterized protein n=1 Tax=Paraphoma chrysanthemicola TaxID=798071 RepID=A0A8K0VSJ9_9PLEO|nr:hypothetical protein FB567DRAFT_201959 [Paraphoma chrysanthemicola]
MGWWRRDPSLLTHSPIHRYAQRVLRDHEAALRTRCFSRTPQNSAQHEDDHSSKRPSNLTNLEWMQLQHYDRWRKRLQDDPYKTLFGASNDMLSGKGLRDWEWVHKTFPKWMLRELDVDETSQNPKKDASTPSRYPKKVEVVDNNDGARKAREPHFPEPSFRTRQFERDGPSGIVSPSDLRRPREGAHVKVVGKASGDSATDTNAASAKAASDAATIVVPPSPALNTTFEKDFGVEDASGTTTRTPKQEAEARESSFIEEFLSNQANKPMSDNTISETASAWRQTALQRRAASGSITRSTPRPSLTAKPTSNASSSTLQNDLPPVEAPEIGTLRSLQAKSKNVEWLIQQESRSVSDATKTQSDVIGTRDPSQILSQLPKDDIDFLSASDIRATMGAKRSRLPTDEQRQAERENLEKAFAAQDLPGIDSMTETGIINNQLVRRAEREMRETQADPQEKPFEPTESSTNQAATSDGPMETSIDRMKKWLENKGAIFAQHFWQDPTEEANVTKTRLYFDKAAHYLKKGQAATRQITDDLERDLPASKALLSRLKSDEEAVDLAIHRLRQRSLSGTAEGLSPRKIRKVQSLRLRFQQTNNELEKAYETLREIAGSDAAKNATGSFKRRLTVASKVLHKNAQLLRMLMWSLQTRLEDSDMDRKILPNYKVLADNLLSLRDTQMTLLRLVERAMLVYGVAPQSADGHIVEEAKGLHNEFDNCEEPFVRARLAADAHLINEIKAHKSAAQTHSDGDHSLPPKTNRSANLEEPSPLAHSLFRPFGPVIDKLGSKEASELAAEKAVEDRERLLSDARLVAEIRKAYEDSYGPITEDHVQLVAGPGKGSEDDVRMQKSFTMLKEDPINAPNMELTTPSDIEPISVLTSSQTPSVETENADGLESIDSANTSKDASTTSLDESILASSEIKSEQTLPSFDTPESPNRNSIVESTSTSEVEGHSIASSQNTADNSAAEADETATTASTANVPTHYTIIIRDPQNDTLSITTSSTNPPRDTSPALPLHQALAALDSPAKFIPYITSGFEVVSANKDILVLRDALDTTASTRLFETVSASTSEPSYAEGRTVNPIDGTTRLSPTGYVGPEESAEHLEREFDERRQAAGRFNGKERERDEKPRKEKQKGGAGVVKTAIWVAGVCYVAGVVGEIASAA